MDRSSVMQYSVYKPDCAEHGRACKHVLASSTYREGLRHKGLCSVELNCNILDIFLYISLCLQCFVFFIEWAVWCLAALVTLKGETWPIVCRTVSTGCQWLRPLCWLCRQPAKQRWGFVSLHTLNLKQAIDVTGMFQHAKVWLAFKVWVILFTEEESKMSPYLA